MANVISMGIVNGSISYTESIDANYRSLEYVVVFDEFVNDSDIAVVLASNYGISLGYAIYVGAEYPFNSSLRCYNISGNPQENNHNTWNFTVEYSPLATPIVEGFAYGFTPGSNPVSRAIDSAYWTGDDIYNIDYNTLPDFPDVPIVNSAGRPFGEPFEVVDYNPVFSWWQVESEATGQIIENSSIYDFLGTINSEAVTICGREYKPGQVKIKGIAPEQYYYTPYNSTVSYLRWKTTYTIEVAKKGTWIVQPLDQGFEAKLKKSQSDSTLVVRPIMLSDLSENSTKITKDTREDDYVTNPVKLDGDGEILADGASPVYLNYLIDSAISWEGLNLAKVIANADNVYVL